MQGREASPDADMPGGERGEKGAGGAGGTEAETLYLRAQGLQASLFAGAHSAEAGEASGKGIEGGRTHREGGEAERPACAESARARGGADDVGSCALSSGSASLVLRGCFCARFSSFFLLVFLRIFFFVVHVGVLVCSALFL